MATGSQRYFLSLATRPHALQMNLAFLTRGFSFLISRGHALVPQQNHEAVQFGCADDVLVDNVCIYAHIEGQPLDW